MDKLLKLVQLHLFGKVNDNITFDFVPLQQMSETDLSTIRKSDTDRDVAYIQAGVVSAEEVRGRLAGEPDSGYNGIDVEDVPEMPDDGFSDDQNDSKGEEGEAPSDPKPEPAQDAEWDESKHPRAENGQFGSGKDTNDRQPESKNTAAQQAAVSVSGSELGSFAETKDLRKAAMQYACDNFVGKSYTNKDSGHEIQVTWQGVIRPCLYHFGALLQVFRVVVGRPCRVGVFVGKLPLYPVGIEAHLIQARACHMAEAVRRDLV